MQQQTKQQLNQRMINNTNDFFKKFLKEEENFFSTVIWNRREEVEPLVYLKPQNESLQEFPPQDKPSMQSNTRVLDVVIVPNLPCTIPWSPWASSKLSDLFIKPVQPKTLTSYVSAIYSDDEVGIRYLHSTFRLKIDNSHIELANSLGKTRLMKVLYTLQGPSERSISHAAKIGNLELVQWLHINFPRCFLNKYVFIQAVRSGSLHIMKWLWNMGCTYDDSLFLFAVTSPLCNLEILKWLVEKKIVMRSPDVFSNAVSSLCNLEILIYLKNLKCKIDEKGVNALLKRKDLAFEDIQYLTR